MQREAATLGLAARRGGWQPGTKQPGASGTHRVLLLRLRVFDTILNFYIIIILMNTNLKLHL